VDHNVLLNTDGYASEDIAAWWTTPYPSNTVVATVAAVGFTAPAALLDASGDYRLTSESAYHNTASDSTDYGCDIAALNAAIGFTAA
jgi:hypothetical protein